MANVAVLCGRERRRRWTTAEKLRLVADSLLAGLSVAEFARRHDIHPNLLHVWRRQAQTGELSAAPVEEPGFVPVSVADESGMAGPATATSSVGSVVEVMLRNDRVLRLPEGVAARRVAPLADAAWSKYWFKAFVYSMVNSICLGLSSVGWPVVCGRRLAVANY
jgi:transposase